MGDQERKRNRAPMNYALFDAASDDDGGKQYNVEVLGGIWKELILTAKKYPDDFSDFTPPAKKVKDLDCSISSSSESKISSSSESKKRDDKKKHKSSHKDKDKDKERNSSSNMKDREKHKSSSKEKERDKTGSSKDRDKERHKSSSKDRDRDKRSSSRDKDRSKHRSSSKDKDRDRDKRSSSKDKERHKHEHSSRDKGSNKRSKSKDRESEKAKSEHSKSGSAVDKDSVDKKEGKRDEKNDLNNSSRKERSRSRSQDKDKDKSQDENKKDKTKERRSTCDSKDKCKETEKNSKNKDGRIVEVCYDDIKFNMSSEASKGDKVFKAIPVLTGPLTSTQKSTPERRKPKERISVEEKIFQRELEAALSISKLEVTVGPETLNISQNESEKPTDDKVEKTNDAKIEEAHSEAMKTEEKGDESEKRGDESEKQGDESEKKRSESEKIMASKEEKSDEELKVPKLIIKVKTNENGMECIQKDQDEIINDENNSDKNTSSTDNMPIYQLKKDGLWQELETEKDNSRIMKLEKEKTISENNPNTETNKDTDTVEKIASDSNSKSCNNDTNVLAEQSNSVYENPQPSTSTGFISGKRQRKTVVFKEESDSQESDIEDEEFSVPSDSKDSSFEISPMKKPKKEHKGTKPSKQATKDVKTKENKGINAKEKPLPAKGNSNRISPRSRGKRKSLIIDDDSDTEEFNCSSINSQIPMNKENKSSVHKKDDIQESISSNLDKNKSPQGNRSQKSKINVSKNNKSDDDFRGDPDDDDDDSEFKTSSKNKSKPASKDKQNTMPAEEKTIDIKDDTKENNPIDINSPKLDKNKPAQVKRSRKATVIESDSDNDDNDSDEYEDIDCDSDDSEFKPSPKKKSKSASSEKLNKVGNKKATLNEKSKKTLNTKSSPVKAATKSTPVNTSKSNISSKLVNVTPIRNTGITPSVISGKSLTTGISKPGSSPTQNKVSNPSNGRVSSGLVKTAFRSPLLNTSGSTPNYIPRSSTTPEVKSIGLRIGLSRNRAFKPLHPNLPRK